MAASIDTCSEEDDENTCCICLSDVTTEQNRTTTDCGHVFHSTCIFRWVARDEKCPMCKSQLIVTSELSECLSYESKMHKMESENQKLETLRIRWNEAESEYTQSDSQLTRMISEALGAAMQDRDVKSVKKRREIARKRAQSAKSRYKAHLVRTVGPLPDGYALR